MADRCCGCGRELVRYSGELICPSVLASLGERTVVVVQGSPEFIDELYRAARLQAVARMWAAALSEGETG